MLRSYRSLLVRPPTIAIARIPTTACFPSTVARSGYSPAASYSTHLSRQNISPSFQNMITRSFANHRHKRMIKLTKGYFGRVNLYAVAKRRVDKARVYAYRDRKVRKREFRLLWIQRLNAATRMYGMPYSRFIFKLNRSGVKLDRKVLADLAVTEPLSFRTVLEVVKSS